MCNCSSRWRKRPFSWIPLLIWGCKGARERPSERRAVRLGQVPRLVVMEVASLADKQRYETFVQRSYVEDNRRVLLARGPSEASLSCPAPRLHHGRPGCMDGATPQPGVAPATRTASHAGSCACCMLESCWQPWQGQV